MSRLPKNHRQLWTEADVNTLKSLAAANTPTRVIGLKLGRSETAVRSRAQIEDVTLKPTNQSPYWTKKK